MWRVAPYYDLNRVVATARRFNSLVLSRRDTRVGRVNELLSAMKLVKSCAWETGFRARVSEERDHELKALFRYQACQRPHE